MQRLQQVLLPTSMILRFWSAIYHLLLRAFRVYYWIPALLFARSCCNAFIEIWWHGVLNKLKSTNIMNKGTMYLHNYYKKTTLSVNMSPWKCEREESILTIKFYHGWLILKQHSHEFFKKSLNHPNLNDPVINMLCIVICQKMCFSPYILKQWFWFSYI